MLFLIKKYAAIIVLQYIIALIISYILGRFFPQIANIITSIEITDVSSIGLDLRATIMFLFNIVVAIIMNEDMKKLNQKSFLILLLTCSLAVCGTILFLLVASQNNILKHEKQPL